MGGVTTKSKEVKAKNKAKEKSPRIDEYGYEVP